MLVPSSHHTYGCDSERCTLPPASFDLSCLPRSPFDLRKAGTWRIASVPLATLSARPRPRMGCGRYLRWPLGLASRSARISAGGAAPFFETHGSPPSPSPLPSRGIGPPRPAFPLLGLHAEGSILSSLQPRTALSFANLHPSGGGGKPSLPSSLPALWEPRAMPCRPRTEFRVLLPSGSRGSSHTSTLNTPGSQECWGLGGCNPESQAPGVSALGRGLVSGYIYSVGGMNKGHRLQHVCSSFLSFQVPILAVSLESHLSFPSCWPVCPPPPRPAPFARQDAGQAGWNLGAKDEVMPGSGPWRRVRGVVWSRD